MSGRHDVEEPHQIGVPSVPESEAADDKQLIAWQAEALRRLGYRASTAEGLVAIAWLNGDQADLAHRIADLLHRGATHSQAARIMLGGESIVIALVGEQSAPPSDGAVLSEHPVAL